MIKINLLPENLREIEHTPYPRLVTILIALIVFLTFSFMAATELIQINTEDAKIKSLQEDLTTDKARLKIVENLKTEISKKKARRDILLQIVQLKMMWSRKLDEFNKLVNDKYSNNLWFDNLYISTNVKIDLTKVDLKYHIKFSTSAHFMLNPEESEWERVSELQAYLRDPEHAFGEDIDQARFNIPEYKTRRNDELNKKVIDFPLDIYFKAKSVEKKDTKPKKGK